jgi:hypothetical protein
MPMPHCSLLLTVIAVAANAVAQVGWTHINPATRPPARGYHSIAYDAVRGVTVLFGGSDGVLPLGDSWEWNGVNWTQRVTSVTPTARYAHALAFDITRARVVLFGGTDGFAVADLNDTWEFDGSDWTQMHPASQPSLRRFARMEYDAARAQVVLFGGGVGLYGVPTFNDTWEWNGAVWTPRSPATSPPPRLGHGMTYNFAHARIVLFGGSVAWGQQLLNDTWTWDGTNWSQLQASSPASTTFGLANDTGHDVVVRFGDLANGSQTWLFDHVAWRPDPRTVVPPLRSWCSLAHDIARGRTVLFGGGFSSYFDDTWEYDPGTIARWTASGSGCAGTSGVPALRPVGASLPIVGTTFQFELLGIPSNAAAISFGFSNTQWNGNALPWNLGALGMTGCTLHASPDVLFFAPVVASRATVSWALPNNTSLIGVHFYNQGFVLDPGINPTGATVSNAGAGIIGPF